MEFFRSLLMDDSDIVVEKRKTSTKEAEIQTNPFRSRSLVLHPGIFYDDDRLGKQLILVLIPSSCIKVLSKTLVIQLGRYHVGAQKSKKMHFFRQEEGSHIIAFAFSFHFFSGPRENIDATLSRILKQLNDAGSFWRTLESQDTRSVNDVSTNLRLSRLSIDSLSANPCETITDREITAVQPVVSSILENLLAAVNFRVSTSFKII